MDAHGRMGFASFVLKDRPCAAYAAGAEECDRFAYNKPIGIFLRAGSGTAGQPDGSMFQRMSVMLSVPWK